MLKKLILMGAIFLISIQVNAQKDVDLSGDPDFWDRVYVGGGMGFSTSNVATFISVSPIVGYMITPNLSAGVGLDYQYINYRFADVNENIYGWSVFTRYNISQFFLQAEYSILNLEISPFDDFRNRQNYDRLLFGGGISQPLGRRARINILGMYDFLYLNNGPFASPWVFRVFISG